MIAGGNCRGFSASDIEWLHANHAVLSSLQHLHRHDLCHGVKGPSNKLLLALIRTFTEAAQD
jgi:hypothetical protein